MANYRALLLGVGEYEDERITGLPFVPADLTDLGKALSVRGYEVEPVAGPNLGRTQLSHRVQRFLAQARADDRLLIVLSGHGVHVDGRDYLVPSDAELDYEPLPEALVEIGWAKHIENCHAAGVLFVIDACRQGLELGTKAIGTATEWTRGKAARAAKRQVAYMFACSPGQFARYVNTEEEAFSFFSRALRDVAADETGPAGLAGLIGAVQQRLDELTDHYGKPRQSVLPAEQEASDGFPAFPTSRAQDAAGGENDPWVKRASEHLAWSRVAGRPGAEAAREGTIALVKTLSRARRRAAEALADDPWQDEGYVLRVADKMEFLLSAEGYVAPDPPLSPAEAALLVAAPFVKEARWVVEAESVLEELDTDRWWQESDDAQAGQIATFSRAYPRLRRRAQSARAKGFLTAPSAIGWWLAHRWMDRRLRSARRQGEADLRRLISPALAYAPASGESLGRQLVEQIFAPDRLAALVQVMDADPDAVGQGETPGALPAHARLCSTTTHEQHLRGNLVAYLLMLASRLAIDTARLGEILVDHIGIADSVDLGELHASAAAAHWDETGTSRILHAVCTHPAVEIALSAHAEHVNALLAAIHVAADADRRLGLLGLPTRASANGVVPADTGEQRAEPVGVRFRLADDRIQELLMGEQLYRDRSLAIRELYQNALDACRYRQARTEYLRRTTPMERNWRGRIEFRQGVDEDGRAYIECADNGIGMGVRELRELFSQAGSRFTDLPEYVSESAEWGRLDPPIRLFPNSRFGIGVLSYFMLADELVVETCRLDPAGSPGRRLRVTISGPGALFRIRTVEERGTEAGTTVRLYLHPSANPPSCVEVLRQLLWVAEFETSAQHEDQQQRWAPGELSEAAPLGRDEKFTTQAVRTVNKVVPAIPRTVWWCGGDGAILADGLWAGKSIFGAVVNLTGKQTPFLSVDRSTVLDFDAPYVQRTLCAAAPVLADVPQPVKDGHRDVTELPGYRWLCALARYEPVVADAILDALQQDQSRCWILNEHRVRIARFGCFPDDVENPSLPFTSRHQIVSRTSVHYGIRAWRCSAYLGALDEPSALDDSNGSPVLPARPSDAVLLAGIKQNTHEVTRTHVAAAAARLGWSRDAVSARLQVLGYTVPDIDPDAPLASLAREDLALISVHVTSSGPWLDESDTVPLTHLVRAAYAQRSGVPQVAERLRALGFATAETRALPRSPVNHDDCRLVSVDINGQSSWLGAVRAVSAYHVVRACRVLRWSADAVVGRLMARGFEVPDAPALHDDLAIEQIAAALQVGRSASGWIAEDRIGRPGHLILSAAKLGVSTEQVIERLDALGLPVSEAARTMRHCAPTADDAQLLEGVHAAELPDTHVSLRRIVASAVKAGLPVARVAARLAQLGLDCPDPETLPTFVPDEDDERLFAFGERSELADGETVSPVYVAQTAALNRWSVEKAAERLAKLGLRVPVADELTTPEPADGDTFLMWASGIGYTLPLGHTMPIPRQDVLFTAQRVRASARDVARRLAALGCDVPDLDTFPDVVIDAEDIKLLSSIPAVTEEGFRDAQVGTVGHILQRAAAMHLPLGQVAAKLAAFGYQVADVSDPQAVLARRPTDITVAPG